MLFKALQYFHYSSPTDRKVYIIEKQITNVSIEHIEFTGIHRIFDSFTYKCKKTKPRCLLSHSYNQIPGKRVHFID